MAKAWENWEREGDELEGKLFFIDQRNEKPIRNDWSYLILAHKVLVPKLTKDPTGLMLGTQLRMEIAWGL